MSDSHRADDCSSTDAACGRLRHAIEHAAHLLPSQGPIDVFVHHNTLHAFEEEPFEKAVVSAGTLYGCEPYLLEAEYRAAVASGRIQEGDIDAALFHDLGETADELVGFVGTRFSLCKAMLAHPLATARDEELHWFMADTNALDQFRSGTSGAYRDNAIRETQLHVARVQAGEIADHPYTELLPKIPAKVIAAATKRGKEQAWETVAVHLLWHACRQGVSTSELAPACGHHTSIRHAELLNQVFARNADELTNRELVRFTAGYLDQGFREWELPGCDDDYFPAFLRFWASAVALEDWHREISDEAAMLLALGTSAYESIQASLDDLGVAGSETDDFVLQTLLSLRGWAGMVWQMETNAEWAVRPAPQGTLAGFLAARLLIERAVLRHLTQECEGEALPLANLRSRMAQRLADTPTASVEQRAFVLFQLAQALDWTPFDLARQTSVEWKRLIQTVESFDELARRRVFHLAYERRFRVQTLDALVNHRPPRPLKTRPDFQLVCCIDDREESFRRHVEELSPNCETFGFAGFYGVAIYYRGNSDAHFRPLCPVNIKPDHYITEESAFSLQEANFQQVAARRRFGKAVHRLHFGTRSLIGGGLVGLLGTAATVPLVFRVLFPRATARIRRSISRLVTPPVTELTYEHLENNPASVPDAPAPKHGFTIDEMTNIVAGMLKAIGLTKEFSPLVFVAGHGSSSVNNPHAAAYDCGACGGGKGGPNARAFADMANDPRVRRGLSERGISVPDDTFFVGCYHNTADDAVSYYDLDAMPAIHRQRFLATRQIFEKARRIDALERCRRFVSAPLGMSPEDALRHVEGRSEDLSQARPELGHATNAICVVGRRSTTRGLFLDRRAFLTSYDSTQDDEKASILAGLLSAVIPVCAGINLEYFFSRVDRRQYGCDTKLPHNMTSLLGVMDGAESDLRTGLPWQMVEIHEAMRIVFVIETTPKQFLGIMAGNPTIDRLVRNRWVQIALQLPDGSGLQEFVDGEFQKYRRSGSELPVTNSSTEWFRGKRDHLPFCTIATEPNRGNSPAVTESSVDARTTEGVSS